MHTYHSDGQLGPAELLRHAQIKGYRGMVISDHVDFSNVEPVLEGLNRFLQDAHQYWNVKVLPGVELTHNPVSLIGKLLDHARNLGAAVVLVHGETIVEPVQPGTNRAAIEAGADILAHPGLISEQDARLAAQRGVMLEVTAKNGHCLTNGHVVAMARETGAKLVFGTDSHMSDDLVDQQMCRRILKGAGLTEGEIDGVIEDTRDFFETRLRSWEESS